MKHLWNTAALLALVWSHLAFAGAAAPAEETSALVTFYSHGSFWTTGLPGSRRDIYIGGVFDGDKLLFVFSDSFRKHNDRFITLRLPAGMHTFGASNGKRPTEREKIDIELKPGVHYFIRAQGESAGVPGVFTVQHGRLDPMSCVDAQEELQKTHPLRDKALAKRLRPQASTLVVAESTPPGCS